MNGTSHLAFGTAVAAAVTMNLDKIALLLPNIPNSAEMGTLLVMGGIIGSIFPDIDAPQSYAGKLCAPVSKVIGGIHKVSGMTEWRHRGILHDGAVYLAGLLLSYLYFTPLIGFFLGALTHIFLDMFNPAGIPFLFGVKHFRLGKMRSDSKAADIFSCVCTAVMIITGIACRFVL